MNASEESLRADRYEEAASLFVRKQSRPWSAADQSALEARLAADPALAEALRKVEQSSEIFDRLADRPEIGRLRNQARARAWQAQMHSTARRRRIRIWATAASAAAAAVVLLVRFSMGGFVQNGYETGIAEQRIIELPDRSRLVLDALTQVHVKFSEDVRLVELVRGQAQFSVAKDPTRPFKVRAGDHNVVALGTIFTVEYVDSEVRVAMIEGRTAVVPRPHWSLPAFADGDDYAAVLRRGSGVSADKSASPGSTSRALGQSVVELEAGEELRIDKDGHSILNPAADLQASTAWRRGKVIFRGEPMAEAVNRLNRYSRRQMRIVDPRLATLNVSGVFEVGDTDAFLEAVQMYLPVRAIYSDPEVIRLEFE